MNKGITFTTNLIYIPFYTPGIRDRYLNEATKKGYRVTNSPSLIDIPKGFLVLDTIDGEYHCTDLPWNDGRIMMCASDIPVFKRVRLNGYYWVKRCGIVFIARYHNDDENLTDGKWSVCGDDGYMLDSDFQSISKDPITPPETI